MKQLIIKNCLECKYLSIRSVDKIRYVYCLNGKYDAYTVEQLIEDCPLPDAEVRNVKKDYTFPDGTKVQIAYNENTTNPLIHGLAKALEAKKKEGGEE